MTASLTMPSWVIPTETTGRPPGRHLALAPGVLVTIPLVRRAADLDDDELPAKPAMPVVDPFDPPQWHGEAACRDVDRETYFSEDKKVRVTLTNQAKKLCAGCPVARVCLEWALREREEFGIWAGTSGIRRVAMFQRIDAGQSTVESEMAAWFSR